MCVCVCVCVCVFAMHPSHVSSLFNFILSLRSVVTFLQYALFATFDMFVCKVPSVHDMSLFVKIFCQDAISFSMISSAMTQFTYNFSYVSQ